MLTFFLSIRIFQKNLSVARNGFLKALCAVRKTEDNIEWGLNETSNDSLLEIGSSIEKIAKWKT